MNDELKRKMCGRKVINFAAETQKKTRKKRESSDRQARKRQSHLRGPEKGYRKREN